MSYKLISGTGQTQQAWQMAVLPEIFQKHLKAEIPDSGTSFIRRYISQRIRYDGNAYVEGEALSQAIAIHKPRIICCTVSIIQTALEMWNNKFSPDKLLHLIVNEAGLLPKIFLFELISFLSNIQRLLLTEDYKLLPPYFGAILQRALYLSHKGAFCRFAGNVSLKNSIKKNFRSHPRMVEAISAAFYDGIPSMTQHNRLGVGPCGRNLVYQAQIMRCQFYFSILLAKNNLSGKKSGQRPA